MALHICALYYVDVVASTSVAQRTYLPALSQSIHATILANTSRSTLTQTYVNTSSRIIKEARYSFPLYDGVSVVAFTCTINNDRVIRGVVKEKQEARKDYNTAVQRGETASLLEQLPDASDVFTTTVGNIPAGAEIRVEIVYLGELKHDAQVDGIRYTIPMSIAPRYGSYPSTLLSRPTNVAHSPKTGMEIVVDAEMPEGSAIKSIQSPSHPIAVTIGSASTSSPSAMPSLRLASATLSLGSAELDGDFVLNVITTDSSNPVALLETHPTIPYQRALLATLVPRFNLPSTRPEVVFVCDRSGSMGSGARIPNLKTALGLFLKSLPIGVKFNICSFGSRHEFLFPDRSRTYDESSLDAAMRYVGTFDSNFGGTEILTPIEETFKRRYKDMDLEVFLLTDGEVWNQENLFKTVDKYVEESKGAIRLFTLGVGSDVSHALIEGLARSGNGFSQTVMDNEKMDSKVVRMLKAAITPHITDYSLEVRYGGKVPAVNSDKDEKEHDDDDDFEVVHVEKVLDALAIDVETPKASSGEAKKLSIPKKVISLFDKTVDPDVEMKNPDADASNDGTGTSRYAHVPAVTPPALLQAPSRIPPLFPFSRTSVYILLSPESRRDTPTAVVLRGTSPQGPLELEIPVTNVAEKGETIHQLAARKAVQELEEGRGWIYHATAKGSSKKLRDQYDGLFSDMVEREAVRLGVQFQVGGKWCSFVATDDKGILAESESSVQEADADAEWMTSSKKSKRRAAPAVSATPNMSFRGLGLGRGGVTRNRSMPESTISYDQKGGSSVQAKAAVFGAPRVAHRMMRLSSGNDNFQQAPAPPGSGAPSPAPASFMALEAAPPPPPSSIPYPTVIAPVHRKESGGLLASIRAYPTRTPETPLETIIRQQNFAGYWTWNADLAGALGIEQSVAEKALASKTTAQNVVATAAVVAFLRKKLPGEKDSWEMLADKAVLWLEGSVGDVSEILAIAESLY